MAEASVTEDAFYGGRLTLRQPAKGHRSGTDAVLLAAAVPRDFSGLCYDIGSGVGAAGLGVALACPNARVRLVENDPAALALAEANVAANGLADRVAVVACDLFDRVRLPAALPDHADLIVTNPPFHAAGRVRASPDAGRRAAHVMPDDVSLEDWIKACLGMLAPKGTFVLIHGASALPEILAAVHRRLGGVTIMGIHGREGEPAKRLLVRGSKGSRAGFGIRAPLVLHGESGFTEIADQLHRGERSLIW